MIELFSGENFDAKSSKRLNRKCDFIFAKSPGSIELIAPLIDVCEAEKGDIDDPRSLSQNSAQLLGARIYNQKRKVPCTDLYGVCTNGYEWIFLLLKDDTVYIDKDRYNLLNLPQLLGIWQKVINTYLD